MKFCHCTFSIITVLLLTHFSFSSTLPELDPNCSSALHLPLHPALNISRFSFYLKNDSTALCDFARWIKRNPSIQLPTGNFLQPDTATNLERIDFLSALCQIDKDFLTSLLRLSENEWSELDHRFIAEHLDYFKKNIRSTKIKLDSRIIEAGLFGFQDVQFKETKNEKAVFLGSGLEADVYAFKLNDNQPLFALKKYRQLLNYNWAKCVYAALQKARAPMVHYFDFDDDRKSLLLEISHGLNLKKLIKYFGDDERLVVAFKSLLIRENYVARQRFDSIIAEACPEPLQFNPHFDNWFYDVNKDRFIILDPY